MDKVLEATDLGRAVVSAANRYRASVLAQVWVRDDIAKASGDLCEAIAKFEAFAGEVPPTPSQG